jgi:hypothetical protein
MGYGENYGDDSNDQADVSLTPKGTYRARGVAGTAQLGKTENGAAQLAAAFEISEGPYAGTTLPWYGYFTDKTKKRTLESLRLAGWSNDDIGEIEGFGDTEVDIVVGHNTWEGKTTARVDWVNRAGSGGIALKSPMNDAEKRAFAAKLKGEAVQSRKSVAPATKVPPKKNGKPAEEPPPAVDDDIPF